MYSMTNLTPRRTAILTFIRERIAQQGQPPSLAEIAEAKPNDCSFCSYPAPTPSCCKLKGATFTQYREGDQTEASRAWSEEKGVKKGEFFSRSPGGIWRPDSISLEARCRSYDNIVPWMRRVPGLGQRHPRDAGRDQPEKARVIIQ